MARKSEQDEQPVEIHASEPVNYIEQSPFAGLAREEVVEASVAETLKACGMNWVVEKRDMFIKGGPEGLRMVPDRKAIVKLPGEEIIGTAGKLFTPIQNLAAFSVLQEAIDQFGCRVVTAGALGNGDRVWMLLSLPQDKKNEVTKGDEIKPYFLVSNAHTSEKSQSLQARFTSIRVYCENSLEAAKKADRAAVSIPHHKNAGDRLDEITKVVKRMYEVHAESIRIYQTLIARKVNLDEVAGYLRSVFKLRDEVADHKLTKQLSKAGAAEHEGRLSKVFSAREQAMWLLDNGKHNGRTAWGAYNAVTEYIDHVSILKQNGALTKNGFETAAFGFGAYQKRQALDQAMERWAA